MARGVSALGTNIIAVGIHTGTIVLFKVVSAGNNFQCSLTDSQRCHVHPITDLASSTIHSGRFFIILFHLKVCIIPSVHVALCTVKILHIRVFTKFQITVAFGLKFHWYLRTLRSQKPRTKIKVLN